jgi:hypothetical protein
MPFSVFHEYTIEQLMHQPHFPILLTALALATTTVCAQNTAGDATLVTPVRESICAHLTATGRVTIHQDARLEALVTPSTDRTVTSASQTQRGSDKSARITTMGYRIRIFSGNDQTASKNRAQAISQEITQKYPDLDLYLYFKTPNWRLTAGNFRTSEEAYATMAILKKEFPKWGREMFIVRDEIELPVDE